MRGLRSLAWRSLVARRARTLLTVLGIGLGVGVLFASLATSAGIERSIDRTVGDLVGRADLRVSAFLETGLSPETVEAIRTTPGVDVAVPALERRIYVRRDVGAVGQLPGPVTVLGIDPVLHPRVHDLHLIDGSPLLRREEAGAVISERLAASDGLRLGGELTLDGPAASERFRVVGIVDGDGPLVGASGRLVMLPIAAAARVFGTDGVDRVDIVAAAPLTAADVEAALVEGLTGEPYVLSSPRDLATSLRASTADFQATMALIATVALFVGAFLIFNTMSMTVAERIREVGLLRAAGATRRQVTGFIVAGGSALGVLGGLAGLAIGLGLAALMAGYVESIVSIPYRGLEVPPSAFVLSFTVGLLVTIVAALEPAWRAGRIPPIEALRLRAEPARGRGARLRWLIAVFSAIALIAVAVWPRSAGDAGLLRSLAVYAVLLVATLLAPLALAPLGRIAGAPFRAARLEERLARASLVRDPSRTALTVGALTVALALIVAVGGVAQNARRGVTAWLAEVVPGDLILTSIRPVAPDEPVFDDLRGVAGVARVSPVATFDLSLDGVRLDAAAFVGADLDADGRLGFVAGDRTAALAAIDAGGAAVLPLSQAERLAVSVGDGLHVAGSDGATIELRVAGIVERTLPGTAGEAVLVGWRDAETRFGVVGADFLTVRLSPGSPADVRSTLEAVARQAALEPSGLDRIQGAISDALGRVFGLFDALALVAVVVAALGIVNTLTMNVLERVREIGVLRATGMTRRQVRRMVVVEAGILGLVGAALGAVTGIVVAGLMIILAGGAAGTPIEVPWGALALCPILGVAISMAAAWYPARLAGRLSIVRAVQFE